MTPEEAARRLREELSEALLDLSGRDSSVRVLSIHPPADLGADTYFRIALAPERGPTTQVDLPTTLAIGYLADEEAAVDEWRRWAHELWARLSS